MNTSSATNKTCLIIGATSSLAQSICRRMAARGRTLILCGRDEEELELLASDLMTRYSVPCNALVADLSESRCSPARIIAQAGTVDEVIIAVGDMGGSDPNNLTNMEQVVRINYLLPAQLASEAADHMLTHGMQGAIAIIGSVAGDRGRRSNYIYGSAKAGLSAFASGLRNRYAAKHIHIMTVKPGFTDTPMTWGMHSPLIARREAVAEHIVRGLEKRKDVIYTPWFWRFIMLIIMHIPERVFKKLKL